jgi:hypothetical protein
MATGESTFAGTQRFRILRQLGSGGMGVVYEALDTERNERVALKTLRQLDADALFRLKNEFHALLDLHHPNLVSLGELVSEERQWFFTMELVLGTDLRTYVRGDGDDHTRETVKAKVDEPLAQMLPRGSSDALPRSESPASPRANTRFDEQRLRASIAQLASGIAALHAANKVHRDIKPTNVLVTEAGRVVLLDFGLATDVAAPRESSDVDVVGTVDYMAPEQAASKAVGPEADWYSVGVVLYEALTGRVPFTGTPLAILMAKQQAEPPAPSTVVAGVPADLDTLCTELLRFHPSERPRGHDVLRRLGLAERAARPGAASVSSVHGRAPFVGREPELAVLREAFDDVGAGRTVTVYVAGESGVGKSAIVRRFVEGLPAIDPDVVVLAGRCYERDSVPYKALDGVVDALSRYMRRLSKVDAAALVPRRGALLPLVFPVLGRVEVLAQAPRQDASLDPQELRARVFQALREVFVRIGERRRMVLTIDDLHWADADSLALLGEILCPPDAPPLLLVTTLRSPSPPDVFDHIRGDVRRLDVGTLPGDQARALVDALLHREGGAADATAAAEIAREAAGHPLFIDELVRHFATTGGRQRALRLDGALWSRITHLDAPTRELLSLVALAGPHVTQDTVARAAEIEFAELTKRVALLRVANLVRTSGARQNDTVEPYHDRVREAVLAHLEPEPKRTCHERLALALETSGKADAEALAFQWRGAGDLDRAARLFATAAADADAALAFDRAASLYRTAIDSGRLETTVRRELFGKLGDALANAGRGADAAAAYVEAAHGATAAEALEMQRRAAEQLLRSGHIDAGLSAIRTVLAAVDMTVPKTPKRALASLLLRRAHIRLRGLKFRERDPSEVAANDLTRIDICWSIGVGLSVVDNIRGADFQTRSLLLALRAGEPYRIARALALEAGFASSAGGPGAERARRLIAVAEALAEKIDNPHALGLAAAAAGVAAYMIGEWKRCRVACARAEDFLRDRCTGIAWELDSVQLFSLSCLYCLGELGEMSRRVPELVREAASRGDLYAATNLHTGVPNVVDLVADDPYAARHHAVEAIRQWSQQGFHVQHFYDLLAQGQIDLYLGDGAASCKRLAERWAALEGSMLLRVQMVRHVSLNLRARSAIAAAAALPAGAPSQREPLLRAAEHDVGRVLAEKMTWSANISILARAGIAATRGDREQARELLSRAIAGFVTDEAAHFLAVARWRLGELVGGDEGKLLVAGATEWMASQRVKNPRALLAMLAPGFAA